MTGDEWGALPADVQQVLRSVLHLSPRYRDARSLPTMIDTAYRLAERLPEASFQKFDAFMERMLQRMGG